MFLIIGLIVGFAIGYYVGVRKHTHIQISGDNSTQVQIKNDSIT